MKQLNYFFISMLLLTLSNACNTASAPADKPTKDSGAVRLVTVDPGHFHAALVQKSMLAGIDTLVHVYAPAGQELQSHLDLVNQYNTRTEAPTHWVEKVYTGPDFLEKMIAEKKGNVVVLAGNNLRKTQYITRSIEAGINVLGDKPMAINSTNFTELEKDFTTAAAKKVLLYDIMTERSEITNQLLAAFAQMPDVFGTFIKGSEKEPAVTIESVHYFYKFVSGKALTRPAWFFDPAQQGEAIADVGTHLIDLVQWTCFPETAIDYKKDIVISHARTWPTPITLAQFTAVTKKDSFPDFLQPYAKGKTVLQTHANGEINYTLKGIPVKLTARWEYQPPEGSGDTHYCLLKGTIASLVIKQGKEESYKPTLYIMPLKQNRQSDSVLQKAASTLSGKYPGVGIVNAGKGWKVNIPDKYKVGHEAHFGQVMQRYLQYLQAGRLPAWETPGMIAKYYTATKALEIAGTKK